MSTASKTSQCEHCNKSSLSLLLLRPSPVAKAGPLVPPGAEAVQEAGGLVAGLLPARVPTESRTVLRLLRAGFVHVYVPSPPPGMKPWQVYQVTDNADLIPQSDPSFNPAKAPDPCTRNGHNAAGRRLLTLPQAHKLGTVWIAYSANLWNDTIKSRNAANPQVMQAVNLAGGSPRSFKPNAANLKARVLECALGTLTINGAKQHDFAFASLAGDVDALVAHMARAAACHPKTTGKELAVVLGDPVGYAAELNTLRLRRHEIAKQEPEKPENAHPLNSSNALLGLQQSLLDANLADSFIQVSPLKTRQAFDASKDLPVGTAWVELSDEERRAMVKASSGTGPLSAFLLYPYKRKFEHEKIGRVVYPDHDARARTWAKEQTAKTWKPIARKVDEDARAAWVSAFDARMKAQHLDPLARFEEDWLAATTDAGTLACFERHFDEHDSNSPRQAHCPGAVYARESQFIHAPAPFTSGAVLDKYLALLAPSVVEQRAVVKRAIVGNQASSFAAMQAFLTTFAQAATGDPGKAEADGGGMRDKAYDFMKGLASAKDGAALKKYAWLGDAISAYSVHHLVALTAAVVSASARSIAIPPALKSAIGKVQALWVAQQAIDLVLEGALSGKAPNLPLLITMKVDVDDAMDAQRARFGQDTGTSMRTLKNQRKRSGRRAQVALTLATDTDSARAMKGDLKAMLRDAASGSVAIKGAALPAVQAAMGSTAILTQEQFLALYARQSQMSGGAAKAMRQVLVQAGVDIRALSMGVGGRLALGSIFVQVLGLMNGLKALEGAKDAKDVRDAWYGIWDSTAGTLGGLLELWAVAVTSRTVVQGGAQAVAQSAGLGALKFAANIAGAAGGAVNAVAAWAKAEDAAVAGDPSVARLYYGSSAAFAGTFGTGLAISIGSGANTLAARGFGGAAARGLLLRVGALETGTIMGMTASGFGLLLLGAGIISSVGAMTLTPTPMQKWASRSYFGKGDHKFVEGDWAAEFKGLQEALKAGTEPAEDAAASVPEGKRTGRQTGETVAP